MEKNFFFSHPPVRQLLFGECLRVAPAAAGDGAVCMVFVGKKWTIRHKGKEGRESFEHGGDPLCAENAEVVSTRKKPRPHSQGKDAAMIQISKERAHVGHYEPREGRSVWGDVTKKEQLTPGICERIAQ